MIRLRPAAVDDAAAIAKVHVETWRDAYAGILPAEMLIGMSLRRHTGIWRALLLRRGARDGITVALVDNAIVGFGSAGLARGAWPAGTGEVHTLYVLPDYQNIGLGRALLRALFDGLRRRGMRSAVIWVVAENPSQFFYETVGGTLCAHREEKLWATTVRTLAYRWPDLGDAIALLDKAPARTRR